MSVCFAYYLGHCHGDVYFFILYLYMSCTLLVKYVIHQLSSVVYVGQDPNKKNPLVVNSKDTKATHLAGKPTCDDESSRKCVHWGRGRGGRGGEGDPLRAYLMSGCLTLWGKSTHISLCIYTKFQGNLLDLDRQVTFILSIGASCTP